MLLLFTLYFTCLYLYVAIHVNVYLFHLFVLRFIHFALHLGLFFDVKVTTRSTASTTAEVTQQQQQLMTLPERKYEIVTFQQVTRKTPALTTDSETNDNKNVYNTVSPGQPTILRMSHIPDRFELLFRFKCST